MFRTLCRIVLSIIGLLCILLAASADTRTTWPREFQLGDGILTIYQPQPDSLEGNILKVRAAGSLLEKTASEPTFGVIWFDAHVDTDRDAGTTRLRDIVVTKVRWPDSKPEDERRVAGQITAILTKTEIPLSLEQLKASLASAALERKSLEGLKNDPPQIVVLEELAELLLYDGEPRSIAIPNSELEQIANSPFAVVRDKRSGVCYLSGGKFWYSAKDPKGPWTPITSLPADIAKLMPPVEGPVPVLNKAPKIIVATVPTELISTDGPAAWKPVGKGELLYIGNTESTVVREVATGGIFVLISGRWFTAQSLSGPWAFVNPDELPASFKDIPPSSDLGASRVSVAGTTEAEEAMLDAQVPQTAAIDRSTAKLEVRYAGQPQFKSIAGTGVEYATNTSAQVLRIEGKYYACDDGVWFVSAAAAGPWVVADSVPMEEIKKIPPSEPVYNTTYVTIYESTPRVVYVGYTPGYLWSYPWHGCPFYGSGWYYPPFWGPVYYPRPVTYGMHVSYNPWTGWNFGFSYSNGFMTIGAGFGWGHGGYYRPGYPPGFHRPPCFYPPGGHHPPYYPPGHRPGRPIPTPYSNRPNAGRPSQLPASANLYRKDAAQNRLAPSTLQRDANLQKADRAAKGPNNVFADRDGNVFRQNPKGWDARDQGQWKPTLQPAQPAQPSSPATRPVQQPTPPPARPSQQPARPQVQPTQPQVRPAQPSVRPSPPASLNRDARARVQGANRSRQRPAAPPPRPAPPRSPRKR